MDTKQLELRLADERQFHDAQASSRARTFAAQPERLKFADSDYLDHASWIRSALTLLQPLPGKTVLDYGCGHGMASVVLARAGARVSAFDLSPSYIDEARQRASANDVTVVMSVAAAEALPYADESLDAVWGNAILHHTELPVAVRELHRVLKPGGVAVFNEPWGENPLLNFVRRRVPYFGKGRTHHEQPFTSKEVELLRESFPELTTSGQQLLGMVSRVVPFRMVQRTLDIVDRQLLKLIPGLKSWCRYMTIVLRKPLL
jgi:ubiquinone/menaquinone biosynthesis C-methylase UbiE